jgi:rhodanese-related sulfurtransferase
VVAPAPGGGASIDEILARARARLRRLGPAEAWEAMRAGALLVDTRPQAQRAEEGVVPGALLVERNVLEWRFDPRSDARLPATGYGIHVIVMCSEGYSSSLAAASLQDLGLVNATDLAGGFQAWKKAGLPTAPGPGPAGRPSAPPRLPPGVPAPPPGVPAQPPEVAVT